MQCPTRVQGRAGCRFPSASRAAAPVGILRGAAPVGIPRGGAPRRPAPAGPAQRPSLSCRPRTREAKTPTTATPAQVNMAARKPSRNVCCSAGGSPRAAWRAAPAAAPPSPRTRHRQARRWCSARPRGPLPGTPRRCPGHAGARIPSARCCSAPGRAPGRIRSPGASTRSPTPCCPPAACPGGSARCRQKAGPAEARKRVLPVLSATRPLIGATTAMVRGSGVRSSPAVMVGSREAAPGKTA